MFAFFKKKEKVKKRKILVDLYKGTWTDKSFGFESKYFVRYFIYFIYEDNKFVLESEGKFVKEHTQYFAALERLNYLNSFIDTWNLNNEQMLTYIKAYINKKNKNSGTNSKDKSLTSLQEDLDKALDEERYEDADKIKKDIDIYLKSQ